MLRGGFERSLWLMLAAPCGELGALHFTGVSLSAHWYLLLLPWLQDSPLQQRWWSDTEKEKEKREIWGREGVFPTMVNVKGGIERGNLTLGMINSSLYTQCKDIWAYLSFSSVKTAILPLVWKPAPVCTRQPGEACNDRNTVPYTTPYEIKIASTDETGAALFLADYFFEVTSTQLAVKYPVLRIHFCTHFVKRL